jgi:hypothetical protein
MQMRGLIGCKNSIVNSMKKITLAIVFACSVFNALACSCNKSDVEAVAHTSEIVLSKLKVSTPSIAERARSLIPSKNRSRIYSVQVIENIKGAYTANTISVGTNNVGSGGCGVNVDYGDTLNVVAYKDSEGITSNSVSVCNIVSDEFAEKVRNEIKTPNEAYNSVETNSWQQFHKSNSKTFYADTKRVTKDEYGSYIWVLMNDASANVKSQKTRLHFACKEKMFTIEHEVSFSEFDAKGKVLTANNFGRQEQYEWLPLTDLYSRLLSYTC